MTLPAGAWGLDIFIGERALVGPGASVRAAVRLISDHLFAEQGATAVALATEAGNSRAQAAYVRAGMRVVEQFLDTDTPRRSAGRIGAHDSRPARRNSCRAMISRCTSDAPS